MPPDEWSRKVGLSAPTIAETDPNFLDKCEAASRESGITLASLVEYRKQAGLTTPVLELYTSDIEWEFTPADK